MPAKKKKAGKKGAIDGVDAEPVATVKSEHGEWIVWFAGAAFLDGKLEAVLNKKDSGWKREVYEILQTEVTEKIADHPIRQYWMATTKKGNTLHNVGALTRDEYLRRYDGKRMWDWLCNLSQKLRKQRVAWMKEEDMHVLDAVRERQRKLAEDAEAARAPQGRAVLSGAGTRGGEGLVRAHDHALTGVEEAPAAAAAVHAVVGAAERVLMRAPECTSTRFLKEGLSQFYRGWDPHTTLPVFRAYVFHQQVLPFDDREHNPFAADSGTARTSTKNAPELPATVSLAMREEVAAAASAVASAAARSRGRTPRGTRTPSLEAAEPKDPSASDGFRVDVADGGGSDQLSTRRSKRTRTPKAPTTHMAPTTQVARKKVTTIEDYLGLVSSSDEDGDNEDLASGTPAKRGRAVRIETTGTPTSKSTHTPASSGKKGSRSSRTAPEHVVRAKSFTQKVNDANTKTLRVDHEPRSAAEARLRLVNAVITPLTIIRQCLQAIQVHQSRFKQTNPSATPGQCKKSFQEFAEENEIDKGIGDVPKEVVRTNFSLATDVYDATKVSDAQLHGLRGVIGGMDEREGILTADTLTRLHMCMQEVAVEDVGDWF